MADAGVKPAMLTLRARRLVTIVRGAPLRRPATRDSALEWPPAHSAYWLERREGSGGGADAAMAVAAKASEAAREAASVVRRIVIGVSFRLAPLCVARPPPISRLA